MASPLVRCVRPGVLTSTAFRARRKHSQTPPGVNRRAMCGRSLSANPQIFRGRFAPVLHLFVAHLSTLIEVAQAGLFHGRDVHKHVLAAVVGLNKSKSLSRIEPLHSTCRHVRSLLWKSIVAVERLSARPDTRCPCTPSATTLRSSTGAKGGYRRK